MFMQEGEGIMSSVQTMANWPRLIKSYDDMPAIFKKNICEESIDSGSFPYMVYIPPSRFGIRRYSPAIIYINGKTLYIVEKNKRQTEISAFPFDEINFIEKGTVLLSAWIKIGGIVDGKPMQKKIEFNSVMMDFFDFIIKTVRDHYGVPVKSMEQNTEKEKFTFLGDINYKFMTYGRKSLMPGSKVLKMLVQPEIVKERVKILGRIWNKTIAPMHLSILTEEEYILLQDTAYVYPRYGIIYTYIPLSSVEKAVREPSQEKDTFKLSLNFKGGDNIGLLFSNEMRNEADAFMDAVTEEKAK